MREAPAFDARSAGRSRSEEMKRRTATAAAIAMGVIILLTAGMWAYYRYSVTLIDKTAGSMKEYGRHYLFVCSEESEMWQAIFDYARQAADGTDAVVEWAGKNSPIEYSTAECLDIGIAEKVDGIMIAPDGSEKEKEAISRAGDAGIPVVSLIRDSPDSGRVCFIGASNFQMGELYGGQILNLLKEGENRVCLLSDGADASTVSNLLYSQIVTTVNAGLSDGCSMNLYTREADSGNDFEAEEAIRGILMEEETPDVLICVNSVQTECAEAALIDYNMVDEVQLIGYYASGGILSAIRRELLPVTITCDAEQVGTLAVTALGEYLDSGHVSDYLSISLEAVTSANVNRYVRGKHLAYTGTGGEGS